MSHFDANPAQLHSASLFLSLCYNHLSLSCFSLSLARFVHMIKYIVRSLHVLYPLLFLSLYVYVPIAVLLLLSLSLYLSPPLFFCLTLSLFSFFLLLRTPLSHFLSHSLKNILSMRKSKALVIKFE